MNRYLYILLSAVVMLAACEPGIIPETKKDVSFYFGETTTETTENSATITTEEPYMTIDGEKYDNARVYLEYLRQDELEVEDPTPFRIYNSEAKDGNLIFTIENLTAETKYVANIVIDGGEYGTEKSDAFTFTTQKHAPITEVNYSVEVEAKGLMATINFSDVAYLADGNAEDINVIKIEYARLESDEWIAKEFAGSEIANGKISKVIPFEGGDYLVENRDYVVRFTLYPKDDDYEPLTSDAIMFKTTYAEVTANIATPTLTLEQSSIKASTENIEVFYDGVSAEEYKHGYPIEYYFDYRVKGSNDWTRIETAATNGDINATLPAQEGNTYEVKAVVVAGAMKKVRESAIAEITVPKKETPTPPAVGAGDTSDIAGTWHLSQWRGTEPSFDIYLDITEDGIVTLWQRLESREWECFYSSANIDNGIITGTYTDGTAWGASYNVSIAGDTMTWIDTNDDADISVYTRCELPDFDSASMTRSITITERFL